MTSTVFSSCGAFRPVVFHSVENSLYTLPFVSPNVGGLQRLEIDSVGTLYVTLTNVVVDSSVQIETLTGVILHNGIALNSNYTVLLDVYSPGSSFNNLIIKVRKASSAPYYRPWDTIVTASVGSQSIYVSQIPD